MFLSECKYDCWIIFFSFLQGSDNCTNTYAHKKKMSVYEGWQDVFLCHHFFIFKFKFSRSLLPGESLVMILPKWWSVGLSFVCDVWSDITWHTHTYTQRKKKNYDWTARWKRKNRWILLDGKMAICFLCFFSRLSFYLKFSGCILNKREGLGTMACLFKNIYVSAKREVIDCNL